MPALPIATDQIVITASRAPDTEARSPASVTIIDEQRIERLDEPLLSALIRLTPSAAVSTSGPASAVQRPTTPCCSSMASRSTTRLRAIHPATRS